MGTVYSKAEKRNFLSQASTAWCPDGHTIGHIAQLEVFPNYRIYQRIFCMCTIIIVVDKNIILCISVCVCVCVCACARALCHHFISVVI